MVVVVMAVTRGAAFEVNSPDSQARSMTANELPRCQLFDAFRDLAVSPLFSQDNTLFVGAFDLELNHALLLKSMNGGLSWNRVLSETEPITDIAFSLNYRNDQTICAASYTTLACSTDRGQYWSNLPRPQVGVSLAALAIADANIWFLALGGGPPYWYPDQGLFQTTNSGVTWKRVYQGGVDDVALSPNYREDHTILIGIGGYHWNGGILKSTDGGRTWQPSREGLEWGSDGVTNNITFSPGYAEDQTVFCLSWQALYKSMDSGAHWARLAKELVDYPVPPPFGSIGGFVVSPRYQGDQTLWLWGDHEGRAVSTDGGVTWRPLPHPVNPVAAGEYCPTGGHCGVELFGVGWEGEHNYVYKSFDGGTTWHCLESVMAPPTPTPSPEIPEGSTLLLLGSGLAGLAGYGWQKRRAFSK